jgi:hypothetical protein
VPDGYLLTLCTQNENEGLRSSLTHSNTEARNEAIGMKVLSVLGRLQGGDAAFC